MRQNIIPIMPIVENPTKVRVAAYVRVSTSKDEKEEVNELQELAESTPPDCKRGIWCGYCKYAKKIYRAFPLLNQFSPEPFTFCGKGDMCKSFEAVEKRD